MNNQIKKPRVVFPFVEAGLGHIMPMRAVCDAFEKKYGDRVEVVRTTFFQEDNRSDLKYVEDELIKEVRKHNKHKIHGVFQHFALGLAGFKISMSYLYKKRWGCGYKSAIEKINNFNADLIFSTHFSTSYYACEAKKSGKTVAKVITYCTDPIIGKQWDYRSDILAVSSALGKKLAQKSRLFGHTSILEVPFLIRAEVRNMTKSRKEYKAELGLPADRFTILLADGAYGAGKLEKTAEGLFKSKLPLNIVAVCGKNEELFEKFKKLNVPHNIFFMPLGFTDKMLTLSAACDLFMGKAGASNLAEPIYFGAPAIVTFCATFVEKWICAHQVNNGCAIKQCNVKKAVALAESFAADPLLMQKYTDACKQQKNCEGAERLADILYRMIIRRSITATAESKREAKLCTTI